MTRAKKSSPISPPQTQYFYSKSSSKQLKLNCIKESPFPSYNSQDTLGTQWLWHKSSLIRRNSKIIPLTHHEAAPEQAEEQQILQEDTNQTPSFQIILKAMIEHVVHEYDDVATEPLAPYEPAILPPVPTPSAETYSWSVHFIALLVSLYSVYFTTLETFYLTFLCKLPNNHFSALSAKYESRRVMFHVHSVCTFLGYVVSNYVVYFIAWWLNKEKNNILIPLLKKADLW